MGLRKPYRKPALQSYGDVRAVTRVINKDFGPGDTGILFQNQQTIVVS